MKKKSCVEQSIRTRQKSEGSIFTNREENEFDLKNGIQKSAVRVHINLK